MDPNANNPAIIPQPAEDKHDTTIPTISIAIHGNHVNLASRPNIPIIILRSMNPPTIYNNMVNTVPMAN